MSDLGTALIHSLVSSMFMKVVSFAISVAVVRFSSLADYGQLNVTLPLLVSVSHFFLKEGFRRAAIRFDDKKVSLHVSLAGVLLAAVWSQVVVVWYCWSLEEVSFLSLSILSAAILLDIAAEPFLIHQVVVNENLVVRSNAELVASAIRSLVLLGCLVGNCSALLAFGVAQLGYSLAWLVRLARGVPLSGLLPGTSFSGVWSTLRDPLITTPLVEMLVISVQKLFLAEGEKALTVWFISPDGMGQLAIVNNLGSVVLRLVFAPVEDIAFTALSKKTTDRKSVLQSVFLIQSIIGLMGLAFGPPVCQAVLNLLYGHALSSQPEVVGMLQLYCGLLFLFACNGVLEAFYFATANSGQMRRSIIFQWVAFGALCGTVGATFSLGPTSILLGTGVSMAARIIACFTIFTHSTDPFHPKLPRVAGPVIAGGILCHAALLYIHGPFARLATAGLIAAVSAVPLVGPLRGVLFELSKSD